MEHVPIGDSALTALWRSHPQTMDWSGIWAL